MRIQPSISLNSPSSGHMAADGSWHVALRHTTSASEWPETCSLWSNSECPRTPFDQACVRFPPSSC